MLKIVEVEIDENATVACPRVDFKGRVLAAKSCTNCTYFAGVAEMSNDGTKDWDEMYAIRCAHVMERRTIILKVI